MATPPVQQLRTTHQFRSTKLVPPITPTVLVSKLANTANESAKPKVSKLPLPISDSPLVIDLPDGQKIVVGKLTQGSVIEVATWRGVGRPDSRTSRLMLGVGSGNVNEVEDSATSSSQGGSPQAPQQAPKPKGFAGFIAVAKDIIKNWDKINWKATIQALIASALKKKPKKVRAKSPAQESAPAPAEVQEPTITPTPSVRAVSEDTEIEEWLNRITAQASKTSARNAAKTPKKATVTKKAAPKSTNSRSKKK